MNIPTKKVVELCNFSCQQAAPVKTDGSKITVNFDYPEPVGLLVGTINKEFKKTWWLNPENNKFTNKMSSAFTTKWSTTAYVPDEIKKTGWLFWISSTVPVSEMDWADGKYEFRYFEYPIREIIPTNYTFINRNSPIIERFYPNHIKVYYFISDSKWGHSPQGRYALCVKIEDFDSSKKSYDYHTMLRYGDKRGKIAPPSMSDYSKLYKKMKEGSISWSGESDGIYYDFSTQVTRLLKVKDNYAKACWYLWIYNFGNKTIPKLRITFVGPLK